VSPANQEIYFGSPTVDDVRVVSGTSIIKTVKTSQPVPYLVYDPSTTSMFGAGLVEKAPYPTSTLYSISSANVASSVKVGKESIAFLYDPTNSLVYVVNLASDTLSLVN